MDVINFEVEGRKRVKKKKESIVNYRFELPQDTWD